MKRTLLIVFLCAAVIVAGNCPRAVGGTLQLTPSLDNTIFSENNNSNALGNLFVGRTAGLDGTAIRRALLMFNVAGNIAPGATIESATLSVTMLRTVASSNATFDLNPLSAAWGAGSSGATTTGGTGAAPTTGDATWNYRFYSTNLWTTPGGDFGATVGTAVIGTADGTTYTFASQAGMVADVQDWLGSPASNFGWIMLNSNETTDSTAREFYSRFASASQEPTLTVTFTVPAGTPAAWRVPVSGNWSGAANWNTGAAPDASGAAAVFNKATTAAVTITLDSPQTVGLLTLGNSAAASVGYTLSGTNALTLNNSGGSAAITVSDGAHVINAPLTLSSNLLVETPAGDTKAWKLTFGTASSISGSGKSLTMSGTHGMLVLSGSDTYSGGTIVSAGTLEVTSNSALASASNLTVGSKTSLFGPVVPESSSEPDLPPAATNAVPEPGTLLLASAGALVAAASCIRRSYAQSQQRHTIRSHWWKSQ